MKIRVLPRLILVCFAGSGILAARNANALVVRQELAATGADADAHGKATLSLKRRRSGLREQLVVVARKLDASTSFDVTIDGVRVGALRSNARGRGSGRFRTEPRKPDDQLLGVDPRGRTLVVMRSGAVVLVRSWRRRPRSVR